MARILVIDDDPDIAELVSFKLRADGHEVSTEGNGTAGLATALRTRPEIVIVDWTLPGLTGPEICSAIRGENSLSDTWLILLTARILSDGEGERTDADEVITKPFSPRALAERVTAALAR